MAGVSVRMSYTHSIVKGRWSLSGDGDCVFTHQKSCCFSRWSVVLQTRTESFWINRLMGMKNEKSMLLSYVIGGGQNAHVCWGPRGLSFASWGCYGLCLRHKLTEFAHSFYLPVSIFMALSTVFMAFHEFFRQLSAFLLFFWSYFCLIGPYNYISLYESLPQPWYKPFWLTGLNAPTN